MRTILHISAVAALTLGAFVAGHQLGQVDEAQPADAWSLVLELHGDAYVMDHGLTLDDCLDGMWSNDRADDGRGWSCEREG